jgi:hypothetical protein
VSGFSGSYPPGCMGVPDDERPEINPDDLYLSFCSNCGKDTMGFGGFCIECDPDGLAQRLEQGKDEDMDCDTFTDIKPMMSVELEACGL